MKQSLNFNNVVKLLLPPDKRTVGHLLWLKVLIKPLHTFRDSIIIPAQDELVERTRYNSQKIVLEGVLNKKFNNNSSGIYIDDAVDAKRTYTFRQSENKPKFISNNIENKPVYMYHESEFSSEFDFVVNVPSVIMDKEIQIKSEVNKYKLCGVNYAIQEII